jgi:hypothetical protein
MRSISQGQPKRRAGDDWTGMGAVVVLSAVAGFYGSTFGPFRSMLVGVIVTAGGGIATVALRGRAWARVVLAIGIALVIGACAYVLLGIVLPHGMGSGSGSCTPNGNCQP